MRIHHLPTILLTDFYKFGHKFQYPRDTTMVYSNLTPRSSRMYGVNFAVAFGFQYFVYEYLINQFTENFFDEDKDFVVRQYKRIADNALGKDTVPVDHIADLHDLQYLPIKVKAVPEGTLVPLRAPALTIRNTIPEFFWLTNKLETLMSNILWMPPTSATTAFRYRLRFEQTAKRTGASKDFIKWQGHDFSMRGMAGIEAACLSGAAHLLSFTGTDTVPAIPFLEEYYYADSDVELVGGSVPATEHSVVCVGHAVMGDEEGLLAWLLKDVYPKGILSYVSDTTDFWGVVTKVLPALRSLILSRDGKLVIRPDSGDPVKIVCGDPSSNIKHVRKGAIQVLAEIFGTTTNAKGFKTLDPHIGLIYGDSITPERQTEILSRLSDNGFASDNVVLGIGSYTYQHVTRDTLGWAIKATYCESTSKGGQAIFKAPKTDDGTKNSAKGLLSLRRTDDDGSIQLIESCDWQTEDSGLLQTIFEDGIACSPQTLGAIRARIDAQIESLL